MNKTILVIEHNEMTRKLIRETLEGDGCNVIEAEDGERGLVAIKNNKPDLILQDLLLPDIDGIELNHKLRSYSHIKNIPILAISGFLGRSNEIQSGYDGFTSFVIKPVSAAQLQQTIATYLPDTLPEEKIGSGKNILLVDDDSTQLKILAFHLIQAGFDVTTATDGRDGLEKALTSQPAAIISDVLMPHLDGFDLCVQSRQHSTLSKTPIILLSNNYIDKPDQILAKKVGANAYINRTPDPKPIIDAVIKEIGNKSDQAETIPDGNFKDEHIKRLMSQLERQITTNVILARQCAQQAAQLSLLKDVADVLTNRKNVNNTVLHDILAQCFDAADVSRGALYLIDKHDDELHLKQHVGYSPEQQDALPDFFGNVDLLTDLMDQRRILRIPSRSNHLPPELLKNILNSCDVSSALIVPLLMGEKCHGVLFLGYKSSLEFSEVDLSFAHTIGSHVIQAVSLAEALSQLIISDHRHEALMDAISCGIVFHDKKGIIIETNKKIEAIFEKRKDQIIGRDIKDMMITPNGHDVTNQSENNEYSNMAFLSDCKIKRGGDTSYKVNVSVTPVSIDNEDVFLSILTDVD